MKRKRNRRDEFLTLIPQGIKKILDVGCGNGSLGAGLKERKIEVVGIEKDKELYGFVKEKLNQVFLADGKGTRGKTLCVTINRSLGYETIPQSQAVNICCAADSFPSGCICL